MPLPRLTQGQNIWIENTKTEHEHGGKNWEFGECLWSPTRARPHPVTGHCSDRYQSMREVKTGDIVLHFLEHTWVRKQEVAFCGYSFAAAAAEELTKGPPKPGNWSDHSNYYRIPLRSFTEVDPFILISYFKEKYSQQILAEKKNCAPKNYPFAVYPNNTLRLTEGNYLATGTTALYKCLSSEIMGPPVELSRPNEIEQTKNEYEEGQRRRREAKFFVRNRALARKVKEAADYRCAVCALHFPERYEGLGAKFIECHHLDPLSDRPGNDSSTQFTSFDRCVALCSNCHSMAHQRIPPYTVAELKHILK